MQLLTQHELEAFKARLEEMDEGDVYTKTITPNDEGFVSISINKYEDDTYQCIINSIRGDLDMDELHEMIDKELG